MTSRSTSLTILATLAVGAALYFTQEICIPIALGLLCTALFRPLVTGLASARIPSPLSATAVVLGCLAAIAVGVFFLSRP
ncbi:MAG: hypothetical protein ACJ8AQ_14430, partial [Gemmatimonadales bacterium]